MGFMLTNLVKAALGSALLQDGRPFFSHCQSRVNGASYHHYGNRKSKVNESWRRKATGSKTGRGGGASQDRQAAERHWEQGAPKVVKADLVEKPGLLFQGSGAIG